MTYPVTARSNRKRLVLFLFMLAVALSLLVGAGCGSDQATTTPESTTQAPKTTQTSATASTAANSDTNAVSQQVKTVTVQAPPAEQPTATCSGVEIVSIEIDKATASVGEPITFTIKVNGDAQQVSVIYGKAGGDVSTAHLISAMLPQGTSGGITTWKTTVAAPEGFTGGQGGPGTCFYMGQALSQDDVLTKTTGNLTFTTS